MKRLNKKSQITMFVIIGVIIISVIALALFINSRTKQEALSSGVQQALASHDSTSAVEVFTKECLQSSLNKGILDYSAKGGGLLPTRNAQTGEAISLYYMNYQGNPTSYYFDTIDEFDQELQKEISDNFLRCIDNYQAFKDFNIEVVAAGEPKITPIFTEIDTKAILEYPITIQDEAGSHEYISFSATVPYRFGAMKEAIANLLTKINEAPGLITSVQYRDAQLAPIANQYGFLIAFDDPSENVVIVSLLDPNAVPFFYNFAVEVKEPAPDQAYTITTPESLTAITGDVTRCVPIEVQFSFSPPAVSTSMRTSPGTRVYKNPGDVRVAGNNDLLCYNFNYPGIYEVDIQAQDIFNGPPYTTTIQTITVSVS